MKRVTWAVKAINPKERVPGEPHVGEAEMEISAVSLEAAIAAFRESPFGDLFIYSITTKKPRPEALR